MMPLFVKMSINILTEIVQNQSVCQPYLLNQFKQTCRAAG